jgi:PAS domain S-box-containing protein
VTAFYDMVTRVRTASEELLRSNDALRHEKAERDAAIEREAELERRLQTLANGSPVLLWVNGPDGCEFVNRAYLDFIGLSSDADVRGYDWSRFVHPDERDTYLEAYFSAFARRSPFAAEFRFLRRDGAWRWMRSEATPRIENDVFVGYVGASVDITERKRAEEALRETDQRKDAFLAILAHELRNPLAPIRTGLELLRVGSNQPDVVNHIRPVLERQVAHMVRLIDDLLDVSRITSGKIQLQRQLTPLKDLVNAAIEAHRATIESRGLNVSVAIPEAPCILDVDPTRFVQVLSNLLHNATKFTHRGGHISVIATTDEEASSLLTLIVADSGEGIAPSTLPHVFDLFVQGESARRAKSGLGIGLGLAKQLVEMHGGTIQADSPGPEQGSSFTIRMPLIALPSGSSAPDSEAVLDGPTIDCRVLVVDDNADAADTLAALVSAVGGDARTAYNGLDGVRLVADFRPEVILLDIGMPEMDGYETCRRLRALPAGQTAYVVAVTGWGQLHDRERALSEGFDAHLTKPADPRVIRDILTRGPGRRVRSGAEH